MDISITITPHDQKFWFYLRKGLFQVCFPILLGFMSFCDFVNQTDGKNNKKPAYEHLYFYTSLTLFVYASAKYILEFIFSMCSEEVIFKKEMNIDHSTSDLFMTGNIFDTSNNHFMVTTKKIFKARYSKLSYFVIIDKICWALGIDSPILIPQEIIDKLSNTRSDVTAENEEMILHTTLLNLSKYHPKKYNMVPVKEEDEVEIQNTESVDNDGNSTVITLLPRVIITKLDKSINEMQRDLFNRKIETCEPNV